MLKNILFTFPLVLLLLPSPSILILVSLIMSLSFCCVADLYVLHFVISPPPLHMLFIVTILFLLLWYLHFLCRLASPPHTFTTPPFPVSYLPHHSPAPSLSLPTAVQHLPYITLHSLPRPALPTPSLDNLTAFISHHLPHRPTASLCPALVYTTWHDHTCELSCHQCSFHLLPLSCASVSFQRPSV